MDLCATPAVDLARMIRSRELPATELLDAVLARIEAVNPSVNAIVTLAAEQARATAAAAVASGMIPFADGSDLAASVDEVFQVLRAAVSVPAGLTASGLPVGLQLVGHYGADRRLLEIAAAVMSLPGSAPPTPPLP